MKKACKMFIHLRCKTEFSILNSTITVDGLKKFAKSCNTKAIGMMDDFSMSGALYFSSNLEKEGVKPILGLSMAILDDERWLSDIEQKLPKLGFLAMSKLGYQNLLKMLAKAEFSEQKSQNEEFYLKTQDFKELNLQDVICISGGYFGPISRYFLGNEEEKANIVCEKLLSLFGDKFYIELTRHGREREFDAENFAIDLALKHNIGLVATNDPHFIKKENFYSYDVLTCISSGRYVQEKNRIKLNENYYLKTEEEMIELFSDIPEAIANTVEIAKRCNFFLKGGNPMLPAFCDNGENENDVLKKIAKDGLIERLLECEIPESEKKIYHDRLDFEAEVITKMGFAGYFLIVSDFIVWAKKNNIPVGPGRGSGAGSIIAWACKITNLDPIKYGLLFERFLNPERVSMPDFDIDFCQTKREQVINYVKEKYGKSRVASIITFGKLQAKAVLKDVGRVLQMSYAHVDSVCKMIPFSPLEPITIEKAIQMDQNLQKEMEQDPEVQNLIRIAMELEGLNRHTSTHAAGIIIGAVDLIEIAPMKKDENSDLPVLGFNMKDAEKMGLLKFDFLGLKTLTVIQQACELAEKFDKKPIDIDKISIHDEKTFKLLQSSKLKGIFQLEAAIPRQTLENIKTDRIEDLIAITSLNRPGPMEFIPDYVRRKTGQEQVSYPHELLKSVLSETFGIIIYQEQVMEVAKVLAGYTLGEADLLRRAMGKKIKEEMDQQRAVFVDGAKKTHDIEKSVASEIFDLVEKFAGYGFNKSHAAAYSLISYQTAYLKANYTIEFFVANLNLDINNTDKINEFISDARNFDIKIVLPNVNISGGYFEISQDRKSIIYGLGALKSVGIGSALEIAKIRAEQGDFRDVFDFAKKVGHRICNKGQVESLICSGSFDDLHKNRKQLFDSVDVITKFASDLSKSDQSDSMSLFSDDVMEIKLPELKNTPKDYTEIEKLQFEMECIGFYLSSHPLSQYPRIVENKGITKSSQLQDLLEKKQTIKMAGVVTKVVQRFRKGGRFCFMSLSDLEGIVEIAIFNSDMIMENKDLIVEGKLIYVDVSAIRDESGLRLIGNEIKSVIDANSRLEIEEKTSKKVAEKEQAQISNHYQKIAQSENKVIIKEKVEIKAEIKKIEDKANNEFQILPKEVKKESLVGLDSICIKIDGKLELKSLIKTLKKLESKEGQKVAINFMNMLIKLRKKYDISGLNLEKV